MATTAFLAPSGFSIQRLSAYGEARGRKKACSIRAQQQQQLKQEREQQSQTLSEGKLPGKQQQQQGGGARVQQQQPSPPQSMAKSKNMSREYGGQWLSCCTRHVRIYAAYIDPVTHAFDQTQMDKLTLLLDPTDEFVWTPDTCQKVYAYFQELVDHYEGAPLSEYTLRLVGSDIEHFIRKLLYDGEIKYNMNCKVLNFSMGKPRVKFNNKM